MNFVSFVRSKSTRPRIDKRKKKRRKKYQRHVGEQGKEEKDRYM